jgi:Tfp pilus assembly protein PilF
MDRYGLPLTTGSPAAAAAYGDGVDLLLSASAGSADRLDAAIAADEGFALAHAARARVHQLRAEMADARTVVARARALAPGATRRERQHVEVIALGIEGVAPPAYAAARAHLEEFPRDALVLSLVTGVFSLLGALGRPDRNEVLFALTDGLAPQYGDDWWFLGMHAFACTEAGQRENGRRLAERSLALRRANGHAAHALAHVFHEAGETAEGAGFLEDWLPGYARASQLHGHLHWHLALLELSRGRPERAWELYTTAIRPGASLAAPMNKLTDSASLLWRFLVYREGPASLPWAEVSEHGQQAFPRAGVAFPDVHCAAACAAAGAMEAFERRLADMEALDARGALSCGSIGPRAVRAMGAFARGDFKETIRLLEGTDAEMVRVGGSHAQRELFEETLLGAYLRAGDLDRAERLLRARLARRPSLRDAGWLTQAQRHGAGATHTGG